MALRKKTWKRRKEVGAPARDGEALGKEGEAPMERKADEREAGEKRSVRLNMYGECFK